MIYGGNTGDTCPDCKRTITVKDWTCPRCGGILDRYLFSTVTPKSLSDGDKDAFQTGYDACMSQWEQTSSTEIEVYRPVPGRETAYRAGWQHASAKLRAKAERKAGRRRGLAVIGFGAVLTLLGAAIMAGSTTATFGHVTVLPVQVLGAGILALVLGLVMLITGASDE